MQVSFMDYEKVLELLLKLKTVYNISIVDIGALEPLLYKFKQYDIVDLVQAIEDMGLSVKLTTNGSLLERFVQKFQKTKIKKIRVSLHSMNREYFNKISSSNNFDRVINSIQLAKEAGLPIELNCLVLKGEEKHALEVVKFAIKHQIKLKLYNLYYAPYYKIDYEKYYITSQEILNILKKSFDNYKIEYLQHQAKRKRIVFSLGDTVEFIIKDDSVINRDNEYCLSCSYINECGEQFAEYLRVDPDFYFYPCYLRKDLRFNLLDNEVIENLSQYTEKVQIRLIVSSLCNHKCVFADDSKTFWCLKQGGDYQWKGLSHE